MTTHGYTGTTEYRAYLNAKTRCNTPANCSYHLYGGRGIEFKFDCFEDFLKELGGDKPTPSHSVDRIDTNGNYEKGNIKWSTVAEQNKNRRKPKISWQKKRKLEAIKSNNLE